MAVTSANLEKANNLKLQFWAGKLTPQDYGSQIIELIPDANDRTAFAFGGLKASDAEPPPAPTSTAPSTPKEPLPEVKLEDVAFKIDLPENFGLPGGLSLFRTGPDKYNKWAEGLEKPIFNNYDEVIEAINSDQVSGGGLFGGGWDYEVVPKDVRNKIIGEGPQFLEKFGGTVTNDKLKKLFVNNTDIQSPDALYAWYSDNWGQDSIMYEPFFDSLMRKEATDPKQDVFGTDKFLTDNLKELRDGFGIDETTLRVATELATAGEKTKYQSGLWATNVNELISNITKTALSALGRLDANTEKRLNTFADEGVSLLSERKKAFKQMTKSDNGLGLVLGVGAAFLAPYLGPKIGATLGLSGAAGTVAGGALLGAGISTAAGGDPLKGAISGAIGSIGSTTYATDVGNALGATGAAAPVVGNAVINSALSGVAAAATGGNVEKSMLAGAIGGAAVAGAKEVAEAILGADNIASIADTTGLTKSQVENVFTTSIANGVIAEVQGTGEFLEIVGTSLVAQGVGAKAANIMSDATAKALEDSPAIRSSVITATGGIATVATNAAIQGEDVGKALENAAPGIILTSVQAGQQEADRQDELAAQREKELVAAQQEQDQILDIIEEQLRTGGITEEGVQVAGADGVTGIITPPPDPLGEIDLAEKALANAQDAYAENPSPETLDFIDRTRAELNRLYESVTGTTTVFDLRQFSGDQGGQGQALFGGGGYSPVTSAVGFNFIGTDFGGNQRFDVGGEGFTLITLPNRDKVLLSDVRDVILYPQKDPETDQLSLTEAPATEVIPEEQLRPVELKPGEAAPEEEGVTGEAGTPGGLTAEQIQRRAEERDRLVSKIVQDEIERLERELQQAEAQRQQTAQNLQRAQQQQQRFSEPQFAGMLGPDITELLEAEIATLEGAASEAERAREAAAAEREGIGAVQRGERTLSDEELYSYLQTGDLPPLGGEGETAPGTTGPGTGGATEEGTGPGAGEEGVGPGAGEEGEGIGGGGEGEGGALTETRLRPSLIFDRETGGRPETTPFASRVTGEALASILGEKQPLFGGDEDEQQAVWNRRSLRLLSRALGL